VLRFELLEIHGPVNSRVFPESPYSIGCTLYNVKNKDGKEEVIAYEIITSSNILSNL